MEQGTGKTRTALELIKIRIEKGKVNKVLWLCPCSVVPEIKRELDKHIEGNHDFIYVYGIESLSSSIRLNIKLLELVKNNNVYLIVDESNLVKNGLAKRTKNIINLGEKCKYKMILNGTPVSKNEKDLFSQWYILDWRILGYRSFYSFSYNHLEYDDYGKIRNCCNVDYLAEKIAPYTYQIKKEECLNLEKKNYYEYGFSLTEEQQWHYHEVQDAFMFQLDEWDSSTIYRMFTALSHVLTGRRIISDYYKTIKSEPIFKNPLDNPRIQCLLENLSEEKHIIWCRYSHEIRDITEILNNKYGTGSAVTFFGEDNRRQREKNIEKFKKDSLFLVANKTCAGYGLNLQFCNRAIYYNNDWDYATRVQSEDRIHRLGQNERVYISDIYAYDTLDRRILNCLWRKESLVDSFKRYIEYLKNQEFDKNKIKEWIDQN